jgi:primosomal protein N' (replication factor Y)
VKVPLGRGNRPKHGYVVALKPTTDYKDPARIKSLVSIDDTRVLVPPTLMDLARWMSRYYVAPLGQVLESIIPSAVKKRTGIGYLSMVHLAKTREETQEILEKTKAPSGGRCSPGCCSWTPASRSSCSGWRRRPASARRPSAS